MKKKLEFITVSEVLYGRNSALKHALGVEGKDIDRGYIEDLFSCDPDMVKTESGTVAFVAIHFKRKIYIITPYELDEEEEDVIEWWHEGAKGDLSSVNSWEEWEAAAEGVAYRGGRGYMYALYIRRFYE